MNPADLNPNIKDAWEGRELKVCSDTVECCKELTRVWDALGVATYRPREGSCSERVTKLRIELAALQAWRTDVTVALRHPGGAHYADVPLLIKNLRSAYDQVVNAFVAESTYVDAVTIDAALATLDGVQVCLENLRGALLHKSEPK